MLPHEWRRVYIAAAVTRRPEARALRSWLAAQGITVHSSWLDVDDTYKAISGGAPGHWQELANMDLADIDSSHSLIALLDKPSTRGGMMVEIGYALGRRKRVYTIGDCEQTRNVFVSLASTHWPDLTAFKLFITSLSRSE